jgi:hypothetical protein
MDGRDKGKGDDNDDDDGGGGGGRISVLFTGCC